MPLMNDLAFGAFGASLDRIASTWICMEHERKEFTWNNDIHDDMLQLKYLEAGSTIPRINRRCKDP